MPITFDMSESGEKPKGPKIPPEDKYLVEIQYPEEKTSQRSGAEMIKAKLVICEGGYTGKYLYHYFMLTGRGAGMGGDQSHAFGLTFTEGQTISAQDYAGLKAYAWVKHEEYNGKTQLKVDISKGSFVGFDPYSAVAEKPGEPPYNFDDIPF